MHGKNDHIFVPITSADTNVAPGKKSCRRVSYCDDDVVIYLIKIDVDKKI